MVAAAALHSRLLQHSQHRQRCADAVWAPLSCPRTLLTCTFYLSFPSSCFSYVMIWSSCTCTEKRTESSSCGPGRLLPFISAHLDYVDFETLAHTVQTPRRSPCVCNIELCLWGVNTTQCCRMETRWPLIRVYHTHSLLQEAEQTSPHAAGSLACVRLRRRQPPPTCRRVQSLTRGLFGSLLADHGKPIQARSASTHIDWCWHLADAAAFSRMGEHRHVTSSCGLGRSPHVFPLPCSATQMFWLILRWSWWRFGFSGPVSPLVAVWPDSEWIYGSVYLRSDCHLSGAVEPT